MKLMIVTDAWEPQVNGVVRTLKMTRRELQKLGHEVELLSPQGFRSVPCPSYPEIELELATRAGVARQIDAFAPDCLHIATEGPLGWLARSVAARFSSRSRVCLSRPMPPIRLTSWWATPPPTLGQRCLAPRAP